jgi:hypothetical protein
VHEIGSIKTQRVSIGFEPFIYDSKSIFISFLKSSRLELVYIILLSPANKIGLDFQSIFSDKSFAWRGKGKGPKIDPCGIPCFITPSWD